MTPIYYGYGETRRLSHLLEVSNLKERLKGYYYELMCSLTTSLSKSMIITNHEFVNSRSFTKLTN